MKTRLVGSPRVIFSLHFIFIDTVDAIAKICKLLADSYGKKIMESLSRIAVAQISAPKFNRKVSMFAWIHVLSAFGIKKAR